MNLLTKSWNISQTKKINYRIFTTSNLFDPNNDALLEGGKKFNSKRFIVLDSELYQAHCDPISAYFKAHSIDHKIIPFVSTEKSKNIDSYLQIFRTLNDFPLDRQENPIIAIGGGVLTDVVGFVASCYRRGMPHIKIPTTLMGYIDASIGIKTGINFDKLKNRMGTFEPPTAVILDKSFLKTLPERHLKNGMGEIFKIALIRDAYLFNILEKCSMLCMKSKFQTEECEEILNCAISDMIEELEPNLYENNLERLADFGHTISNALEMQDEEGLLHGEAVAIDIAYFSVLAHCRLLITEKELERIFKLIKLIGLPCYHPAINPSLIWSSIIERTYHRGGWQRIPVPSGIGQGIFLNNINYEEIYQTYDLYKNRYISLNEND